MTTQSSELVGVAHQAFIFDEVSLKRMVTMFNRIAIPALSLTLTQSDFFSPEFAQNQARLAELGILFEPDVEKLRTSALQDPEKILDVIGDDLNELMMPIAGMGMEEMLAAQEDKEKLSEINQRSAEAYTRLQSEVASGSLDPEKLWELGKRLSVNITRVMTIQLREVENVDAYAVIPDTHSSLDQDDPSPTKHDVVKIVLAALPVPADDVPWEQIIEYRNDPESQFFDLKNALSEIATGSLTPIKAKEKVTYLLNQYRAHLERHQIKTTTRPLETFVVTTADSLNKLADFGQSDAVQSLFSLEHRKLGLLDGESTAAGSTVAYVTNTSSFF